MMNKINEGLGAMGKVIHEDMDRSMRIALRTAEDELTQSGRAVGQWKKNHDNSLSNVNEKIKQQQTAYNTLLRLFDEMDGKTHEFYKAVRQWRDVKTVEAANGMFFTFLSIPNIFKIHSGMESIEVTNNVTDTMVRLHETFTIVAETLECNVKFDAESISEGKFEPSKKFDEALKKSSELLKRALDFEEVKKVAENLTRAIDHLMGYPDPRVHNLKDHMSKIATVGQLFINLVCMPSVPETEISLHFCSILTETYKQSLPNHLL